MTSSSPEAAAMNFSWVEEGLLAGCRGPRTDADLGFLARVGIHSLVRLAHEDETGISSEDLGRFDISDCYEPVLDWTPPTQEQLDRVVQFIRMSIKNAKPVAVSCGAGYGRTGTVLACYLASCGLTPREAIQKLITVRPCSSEILDVLGQKQAIYDFARRTGRTSAPSGV
jgi:atypical dual specificity phosphatase